MARWTTADSEELYQIPDWGLGYFHANARGHLEMRPPGFEGGIDLLALVDDLRRRGTALPILVRFSDLIHARIEELVHAFEKAIAEYGYKGRYRGVFPIKVNQDAHVVDDIVRYSRPHHLGLEAGSKPELQVVLATLEDPEALIVCNGYKDRDYVQMALLARKLGRNCIIVVEKADELDRILEVSRKLDIPPVIGVRAKLSAKGAGRWQSSVGDRAKFGLTVREIVDLVQRLKDEDCLPALQLLHYHIGSQVTSIRSISGALREATRMFTELCRLGCNMRFIDVGGGLGVDYDGSRTNFESSMNYSVQEYAHSVISAVHEACETAGVPHPDVITEAGRAMVAHSSALIFNVVGTTQMVDDQKPRKPAEDDPDVLHELWEVYQAISTKNLQEPLHDATDIRDEALTRFNLGLLSLEQRAEIENMYWHICARLLKTSARADYVPEEVEPLERGLADTYYCNFSVFQSMPDSWAIGQLFPVLPIHRLAEEPTRRAVLADLTCDSDGKIDRFINRRDVKPVLAVHERDGKPYYLGAFLVGAYQEILGDLHNLFGDTHVVHVRASEGRSGYTIEHIVEGNTVREVLDYVSYDRKRLVDQLRSRVEQAIQEGALTSDEGGLLVSTFVQGLESYTYLSS